MWTSPMEKSIALEVMWKFYMWCLIRDGPDPPSQTIIQYVSIVVKICGWTEA